MKNSLTNRFLLTLAVCSIAIAFSGTLFAGPVSTGKEIAPAPPPPVECNWTGFYLGIHGGFFWARSVTIGDGFEETPDTSMTLKGDGPIGGGQFGYDYQFGHFVLGLEARGGGLDFDETRKQYGGNDNFAHAKYDAYGAVTGRVGWAWNKFLFYGKGGAGWVNVLNEAADLDGHSFDRETYSSRRDGEFAWIAGGGFDWQYSCHWSLRTEYLFFGIDDTHSTNHDPDNHNFRHDHEMQCVTVGLNYRFGGPGY